MKFIFESESTISSYEPDYAIDYERGTAVALDLLSTIEADELPRDIRRYNDWYWLRSPGYPDFNKQDYAAIVLARGSVRYEGCYVDYDDVDVRPALRISNFDSSTLKLYKEYTIFGEKWIYIGKDRFLYNDEEVYHRFDANSNAYESSEVKRFLDEWLRELQNKDLTVEEI